MPRVESARQSSTSVAYFGVAALVSIGLRLALIAFGAVLEGLYYLDLKISPYSGSAFHQPPLVLALADLLRSSATWLLPALFIGLDVVIGYFLFKLGSLYERKIIPLDLREGAVLENDKDQTLSNLPLVMACAYLFNPWSMLSCVAYSTVVFENLTLVAAFYFALASNVVLAAFFTALASYFSFYSITVVLPLFVLLRKMAVLNNKASTKAIMLFPLFGGFVAALLFISFRYLGSWEFLAKSYLYHFMVEDLQPNIGLFWYYLAEMFPNFRVFFVFVFQYNVFVYVFPLLYWLSDHIDLVVWLQIGVIVTFKAYPSIGDVAFFLALLPLFYHKIQRFNWGFAMAGAYIYLTFLYPIIWRIWIYYASGNANFYYALNLVTAFANSTIMSEALSAVLKRRFLIKKKNQEIASKLKKE